MLDLNLTPGEVVVALVTGLGALLAWVGIRMIEREKLRAAEKSRALRDAEVVVHASAEVAAGLKVIEAEVDAAKVTLINRSIAANTFGGGRYKAFERSLDGFKAEAQEIAGSDRHAVVKQAELKSLLERLQSFAARVNPSGARQ
jgi:hypothetical protein